MDRSDKTFPQRQPLIHANASRLNQPNQKQAGSLCQTSLPRALTPHHDSSVPVACNTGVDTLPDLPPPKGRRPRTQDQAYADKVAVENKRLSQASASSASSRGKTVLKTRVGPWDLGVDLGTGMTGSVRKARHRETGLITAVKIMNLRKAHKLQTQSMADMNKRLRTIKSTGPTPTIVPMALQREIAILKAMNHPNVIKLYDIWENRGDLYLFTEFVENGELLAYIVRHGRLQQHEAVRIFRQLISGLQYCHRFLLCHRDIKPENILLDREWNVKLADFGMAAMHNNQMLLTPCGSPHYAAPEVCENLPYKGPLADVWSCGVVLYAMMTGELPFGQDFTQSQQHRITNEVVNKPLDSLKALHQLSAPAQDLLRKILERKPDRRITIAKMWHHPLLLAYEAISRHPNNRKRWLGGPLNELSVEDCGPQLQNVREIDSTIIECLCVLWQTDDDDHFLMALLDPSPCYEKVLYHCLHRYRIDQEENFRGTLLGYSASDYHHMAPRHFRSSQSKLSLLGPGVAQSRSRYSIVIPGGSSSNSSSGRRPSMQSRRTGASRSGSGRTGSVTDTDATYDPYRSSKPQVTYRGDPYTRVNVHRDGSFASSSRLAPHSFRTPRGSGSRPPVSSVWESTVGSSLSSVPSSPPELPRDAFGRIRTLRRTGVKRCYSRSSLTSSVNSQGSGSSVTRYRKTPGYKRNVSFRRLQETPPPRPSAPTPMSYQQRYLHERLSEVTPDLPSSPCNRRRSGHGGRSLPDMLNSANTTGSDSRSGEGKNSKLAHSSAHLRDHAHSTEAAVRASSELSQYCDAAFSSSPAAPVPSAAEGSIPVQRSTPLLSSPENAALASRLLSPQKADVTAATHFSHDKNAHARTRREKSLPEPPVREPHALQVQRELAKALQTLKERDKEIGDGFLDSAMAEIERVMRVNAPGITSENYKRRMATEYERRVHSDGGCQTHAGAPSASGGIGSDFMEANWQDQERRHVSDPLPQGLAQPQLAQLPQQEQYQRSMFGGQTIRMVPKSPATPHLQDKQQPQVGVAADPHGRTNEPRVIPRRRDSREVGSYVYYDARASADLSTIEGRLHTIREDECDQNDEESKRGSGGSRLKSWFRRSNGSGSSKSLDKTSDKYLSQMAIEPAMTCGDGLSGTPSQHQQQHQQPLPESKKHGSGPVSGSVEQWRDNVVSNLNHRQRQDSNETDDSEFPYRGKTSRFSRAVRNFFKREKRAMMQLVEPGDTESLWSPSSLGSQHRSTPDVSILNFAGRQGGGGAGVQTHLPPLLLGPGKTREPANWLTRLLQIRPATRALAFDTFRSRMLKEIRSILREWRRFGVRDIALDKTSGRIKARISEENGLGLKPVDILIEVFAIIYSNKGVRRPRQQQQQQQQQRRADDAIGPAGGMSVARMQQVMGAKSSFEKCATQLEKICHERGLLVSDKAKAREMKKCLDDLRR